MAKPTIKPFVRLRVGAWAAASLALALLAAAGDARGERFALGAAPRGAAAGASRTPHPAVCRIVVDERDGKAYGSGALIDARERHGLVVTNWHVVRDATGKIEVVFPSGFRSEGRALKLDNDWDLAALVVWRPPTEPIAVAMSPPRQGDLLTICGYGQGDYRAATGRCTDYYSPRVGLPRELVELDVEARQGDSGGPILNARGELAGVLFGAGEGTTLGSFGGRVERFLASLAPDIGAPVAAVAHAKPSGATRLTALERTANAEEKIEQESPPHDPFLTADRTAQEIRPQPQSGELSPLYSPPSEQQMAAAFGPTTVAKQPKEQGGWSASPAPAEASQPEAIAAADGPDWFEDAKTLLAIVGLAAVALQAIRLTA
ncbi:Periplasmic pH-dependent serine endoprotease DegQ precursor [Pseudobythopirellula maris]|uniref:Periplasmic pH-dependent serine endoprotease DegQ n=1 Tax=Pseudobythopirellula maris TaxID=2527991 RepID=A0A5C5ZI59_9BACT|nr:serine protease [Pseudobythopirellula maris]TWT86805.1 Periplasmic pH-dependent serine endoprotease DegQ precursor [Pseudobythopirellula maris]